MWLDLPDEIAAGLASAAILLDPRSPTVNSSQQITACTLGAGWGTSSMITSQSDLDVYASPVNLPTKDRLFLDDNAKIPLGEDVSISNYGPLYGNVSGFAYPQRPIQMPPEWLAYLNPVSTMQDGSNKTIINAYMSLLPPNWGPIEVAEILTYMLQGGLSIIGLDLPWQGICPIIHPSTCK